MAPIRVDTAAADVVKKLRRLDSKSFREDAERDVAGLDSVVRGIEKALAPPSNNESKNTRWETILNSELVETDCEHKTEELKRAKKVQAAAFYRRGDLRTLCLT